MHCALIGDARMERSRVGDGSPLLKTNKKQAACQEQLRPVSLKLFIHHVEMRRHLLFQPWCAGVEAIRRAGGLQREGASRKTGRKERSVVTGRLEGPSTNQIPWLAPLGYIPPNRQVMGFLWKTYHLSNVAETAESLQTWKLV